MAIIYGCMLYQGLPKSDVTMSLYPASSFATPPVKGTALPASGLVSTVVSGTDHGGDGVYRFVDIAPGQYYVGASYAGIVIWDTHFARSHYIQKTTVTYTQFSTAGTTNNITLFSLPAKCAVNSVTIKHSTPFTGGAISAYTLSVGITGTLAKYAAAFNVFQAAGNTVFQFSTTRGVENMGAAVDLKVAATSTTANLNAATAGACTIWTEVMQVD